MDCPYLAMVSPQGRKVLLRDTPCTCADRRHEKTR
jgi:hypothetical protein